MNDGVSLRVRLRLAAGTFRLDVAFDVPPGITILFGPSGAGKSTTLAAIAGLIDPEEGRIALGSEVWFDSETDNQMPIHERRVAFVFQNLALFPHMTALRNVEYGIPRSFSRVERKRLAADMLERMKVAHLAERRPRTFSGGEAQRVALARAFAMLPRVVLLDEAFSAMDRALRLELMEDVRRYVNEARVPAIQVTHQQAEARAMGERVVLLERGTVKAVGDVDEILPDSGGGVGRVGGDRRRA